MYQICKEPYKALIEEDTFEDFDKGLGKVQEDFDKHLEDFGIEGDFDIRQEFDIQKVEEAYMYLIYEKLAVEEDKDFVEVHILMVGVEAEGSFGVEEAYKCLYVVKVLQEVYMVVDKDNFDFGKDLEAYKYQNDGKFYDYVHSFQLHCYIPLDYEHMHWEDKQIENHLYQSSFFYFNLVNM